MIQKKSIREDFLAFIDVLDKEYTSDECGRGETLIETQNENVEEGVRDYIPKTMEDYICEEDTEIMNLFKEPN